MNPTLESNPPLTPPTVPPSNAVPHDATAVLFADSPRWWTVRARDERFTILTRQAPFRAKGTVFYTIVDHQAGVRGPCNLLGQGWDFEEGRLEESARELLAALRLHADREAWWEMNRESPDASQPLTGSVLGRRILWPGHLDPEDVSPVEISHRNRVAVLVEASR